MEESVSSRPQFPFALHVWKEVSVPFQSHFWGGDTGMYGDIMQMELFLGSSALLWNRKWDLPHNLKFQLHFDCHSVEGTG